MKTHPIGRQGTGILVGALLLLTAIAGRAEEEEALHFRAHALQQLPSADLLAAFTTLVGDTGKVIYTPGSLRLLVNATDAGHAQVESLIHELGLDRPPRNVRIDVSTRRAIQNQTSGGGVVINGGVVIDPSGPQFSGKATGGLMHRSTDSNQLATQTIVTSEGHSASIFVGEEAARVTWMLDWGHRHGLIEQDVTMERVGAHLTVTPRVSVDGQLITVRLMPQLSAFVNGDPWRINFTEVATEVTVQNGASIQIGGLAQRGDAFTQFLTAGGKTAGSDVMDMTLTPTLVSPAGR